jgi:hypothetical protein
MYTLEAINNQLSSTFLTGNTTVPDVIPSSSSQISLVNNSVLRKYANTTITGRLPLAGSGIFINLKTLSGGLSSLVYNNVALTFDTGTTQGIALVSLT